MRNFNSHEFTLNTISESSWMLKSVVIMMAIGLVIGSGYWFVLRTRLQVLTAATQEMKLLRQTRSSKQQEILKQQNTQDQTQLLYQALIRKKQQMPVYQQMSEVLAAFAKSAANTGVTLEVFKPMAEIPTDFFIEAPLQITVRGDYSQLLRFITQLTKLKQMLVIRTFSMEAVRALMTNEDEPKSGVSKEDTQQLKLSMQVMTYRYLSLLESPVGDQNKINLLLSKQKLSPKVIRQDPFQPILVPPTLGIPECKQQFTASTIHRVGTLQQGNEIWALMATPCDQVYPFKLSGEIPVAGTTK